MFDNILEFTIITWIVFWVVQALTMAGACYWLAGEKGRDRVNWTLLSRRLAILGRVRAAPRERCPPGFTRGDPDVMG